MGKIGCPVATLASTDRDVVEKFSAIMGFGSIRVTQPQNPRAKTQYRWEASTRADVQWMASLFLPHLCSRRRARALEIIALPPARIDRKMATQCPQGHPYDDENTYVYVKDGYTSRQCKTCRAGHNTADAQRRRRLARRAAAAV